MNINSSLKKTPIAVVGMSALFADAQNLEEYWNNIIQAVDSITDVPATRWSIDDYYDPDPSSPDKTYCKKGGFLPDIDFNPMEFGLPPNILEVTDASQLLALIAARDAFQHAGYGKDSSKFTAELKAKTGVLLGVGGGQKLITPLTSRLQYPIWEKALRSSGIAEEDIPPIIDKMKKAYIGWNENSFPGMLGNVISGRITNRFDLGGINSVVDAACAASLSAIKMALSELVEGRADMMLTGGVDTDNSPFMYMSFSKTPAFSRKNKIAPFSDEADGMLIGEGVGMLVLKRLEDAERDGDTIYAVIKGVGTSSDGRYKSVYAPRSSGQALAMERAYEDAGFDPSTVGLIEAHGTGTGAGDPTEFESMNQVFSKHKPDQAHIALGSVKSQVGHTKAAAGVAGMIKAILSLHHKVLAPTINVDQPNSKFDLEKSAIYINTETRPWVKKSYPRRASCSAFGFGGINVHIAMEEYMNRPQEKAYRIHQPYQTVLCHAASKQALIELCQNHLAALNSADTQKAYLELSKSVEQIPAQTARLGFVCNSIEQAKEYLELALANLKQTATNWDHPKGIYFRTNALDTQGKVVALFSGQGSQYVGMGKELANAFPQFHSVLEQVNSTVAQNNREALSNIIYPQPVFNKTAKTAQQKTLTLTQNAQPAIGAISMAMYKVLQNAGFQANFTAGHSFGELTALWAAGVYDDVTYIALAKARGEAMAAQAGSQDTGTMLAVKADYHSVHAVIQNLEGVKIANINSGKQVILGGSTAAIANAQANLKQQGFTVIPLPVSAAFHTEFVAHAQKPFAQFIAQQKFQTPQIPVYSNTTAKVYPSQVNHIQYILQEHILRPVYFQQQIENIHQAGGRIFIEFGPKGVLTNLVKTILKDKDHIAIALNQNAKKDSDLQFRQAVLQLRILGLPLGEIDQYKASTTPLRPKSKMNVVLSGYNYVSPQTQKAYTDVLNNDFQIQKGATQIVEKVVEKPVVKEVEKIVEVPAYNKTIPSESNPILNQEEVMNKELVEIFKTTVEHVTNQQTQTLEIFQNFLQEQQKQSQLLLQMVSQQVQVLSADTNAATNTVELIQASTQVTDTAIAQVKNTISSPVQLPKEEAIKIEEPVIEAIQIQEPVLSTPVVNTPNKVTAPVQATAAIVTEAKPTAENGLSTAKIEQILLDVISAKTGYPAEMLELSMDMEADLGIDSIKRVEIFGAMTEQHPEVQGVNPNELTELRTLAQIVEYLVSKSGGTSTPIAKTTVTPVENTNVAPVVTAPSTETSTDSGLSKTDIEKILLDIISTKTGYPAEMLELNMDMEADLGIDSIKRVEIFGAMTEQHPEIQGVNPNDLTDLRTLAQIVDYISTKAKKKALV
ncbi:MAG: acyltransferase domain-containing protein [Saprospiraceae bacterium]|nr:acyltransferase domain-containing protein [Saprospiraceae bacterium]